MRTLSRRDGIVDQRPAAVARRRSGVRTTPRPPRSARRSLGTDVTVSFDAVGVVESSRPSLTATIPSPRRDDYDGGDLDHERPGRVAWCHPRSAALVDVELRLVGVRSTDHSSPGHTLRSARGSGVLDARWPEVRAVPRTALEDAVAGLACVVVPPPPHAVVAVAAHRPRWRSDATSRSRWRRRSARLRRPDRAWTCPPCAAAGRSR